MQEAAADGTRQRVRFLLQEDLAVVWGSPNASRCRAARRKRMKRWIPGGLDNARALEDPAQRNGVRRVAKE